MHTKFLFSFLIFLFIKSVVFSAQNKDSVLLKHEIRIVVDNDVFTSPIRDRYYSSGLFGIYRWMGAQKATKSKKILSIQLNQRIFTPENVTIKDPSRFDRPYAGQISLTGNQEFYRQNNYIKTALELGWMGPGSLTGTIQENWHKFLNLPYPEGWEFQIGNSPIVNLYSTLAKTMVKKQSFDMISESNVAAGTAFCYVRQEVVLRLGKINPLQNSVHYNGQLGSKQPVLKEKQETQETYLFYSPGFEYALYNSTIEGNLFGGENPHTLDPRRAILQQRAGLMAAWTKFDIQIIYYFRTKETNEAVGSRFAGVHLNFRF